ARRSGAEDYPATAVDLLSSLCAALHWQRCSAIFLNRVSPRDLEKTRYINGTSRKFPVLDSHLRLRYASSMRRGSTRRGLGGSLTAARKGVAQLDCTT